MLQYKLSIYWKLVEHFIETWNDVQYPAALRGNVLPTASVRLPDCLQDTGFFYLEEIFVLQYIYILMYKLIKLAS